MSEAIYRPLIEDMLWSYSRIDLFSQCPYAWFLHYIRNEPEQPRFYTTYGAYVHGLLDMYYKGEIAAKDLPVRYLSGFSSSVKGERPSASVVEKYVAQGLSYFSSFEPLPYNTVCSERHFTTAIPGNIHFHGVIDYIGEKNGEFYIVDHKSADIKPRGKSDKNNEDLDKRLRQLYLYAKFVKDRYKKFPKSLVFNCFRTGVLVEEPFSENAYNASLDWFVKSVESIEGENDFPPNIEWFYCRYLCGHSDSCCYFRERGR